MTMTIVKNTGSARNAIFYTTGFRKVLEDHLPYLRVHPTTRQKQMTLAEANRYKWNLSAFLATVVEPDYVWLTLRLNDYLCDQEFDGTRTYLLIPSTQAVDNLVQCYLEKLSRIV